ncbi:hypothetical protein FPV24_07420 [Carnobacterium sp. PL24RED07]|uniref:hypothetical protein n=1 Tax=Lactobacillales TaxID=186826 RepID=UPI0011F06115|nr:MULTISPECIES: hypothetical protein [unclassified Carnobacterium]KAF3299642.1 hypothetical protein FPV21_06655 [Carnobacterium sp. PL12RED10]KAF3299862.1 hypothetical protein FPV22_07285 [Carnobacterium sp. PL26RED25]KAF3304658.1 hypothetical protein FPV24_07420 [Carnobacterium sp. PL24RED07]
MDESLRLLLTGITITDVIQAFAATIGIIASLIALWQSKKSIKLTEKSIREANRPVVAVYLEYSQVISTPKEYLVIKNFGNTPATIDLVELDTKINIIKDGEIFTQSVPFILAPKQSFSTVLRVDVFDSQQAEQNINVKINYHDSIQQYSDTFNLNQNLVKDMRFSKTKPSKNSTVQQVLSQTTEEIIRKNF